MKQLIVGCYDFGVGQCELVLRAGIGGEFYVVPEPHRCPRIKVGADYDEWREVMSCLLHEIIELQMTLTGCRYNPAPDCARDHASYLFLMTHPQFSEVCARSAFFISEALPDLAKAWKKWKK